MKSVLIIIGLGLLSFTAGAQNSPQTIDTIAPAATEQPAQISTAQPDNGLELRLQNMMDERINQMREERLEKAEGRMNTWITILLALLGLMVGIGAFINWHYNRKVKEAIQDSKNDLKEKKEQFEKDLERLANMAKEAKTHLKEVEVIKQKFSKLDFGLKAILEELDLETKLTQAQSLKLEEFKSQLREQMNTFGIQALADYYNIKSVEAYNEERWADALRLADHYLDLKEKDAEVIARKSRCLNRLGQYGEALVYSEVAIQINENLALAHFAKGTSLGKLERNEEAIQSLEKAIELSPEYFEALNNLAIVNSIIEKYDESIRLFKKVIVIRPEDIHAKFNLGLTYKKKGDYENAIHTLLELLKSKPEDHAAWYHLGLTYQKATNLPEARRCFKKAVELEPKNEGYITALDDLGPEE